MNNLIYEGNVIRLREATGTLPDMLNLTDMWRAAGEPANKEARQWRRLPSVREYAENIARRLNVEISHVYNSRSGRYDGATWAHWELGLDYAAYLSHKFHAWANLKVREAIEGHPQSVPAEFSQLLPIVQKTHNIVQKLQAQVINLNSRRRRDFHEWQKERGRRCIVLYFSGLCPFPHCDILIVMPDFEGTEELNYDHVWGSYNNNIRDLLLCCKACNQLKLRDPNFRRDHTEVYQLFQKRLAMMPGEQLLLI